MKKAILLLSTAILLQNCKNNGPHIAKVNFQAGPCIIGCPIFNMAIDSSGRISYDAEEYEKLKGNFNSQLAKEKLDSLNLLIRNADMGELNDKYSASITDQPTYILTVTLANGYTRSIDDYGRSGPQKLQKVYDFIFRLRRSQQWQPGK